MKPFFVITTSLLFLAPNVGAAPKTPAKSTTKKPVKPATKKPVKPVSKVPVAKPVPKPAVVPTPIPVKLAPTPTPIPVETGPKTWALLVGVGQYQNNQVSSLRFPAKDATGLRDALIDPTLGSLPPGQVLLLTDTDATREKITGAVNTFLRPNVQSGDKVVVFLAGHGIAKGVGLNAKSFLLPTDVKGLTTTALDSSAVPLRALADDLATLPASQFIVFVDACREDPTPGRGVKGNALSDVLSRGIEVVPQDKTAQSATFFACSIGQRAFEDEKYGHGVFTNWILEGLRQGAIAQKPDGAIDMGLLSSYVGGKVNDWAKDTSATGNLEVSQTPELVATHLSEPLMLLRVKRAVSDTPIIASAPRVFISASPDSAVIAINGARAGVGSVEKSLPTAGDYSVTVSAPGYTPFTRTVKVLGGYEHQLQVQLDAIGATPELAAIDERTNALYKRALEEESREQYPTAEQGYVATIASNPKFGAAYESLINLHRLDNRNLDVLADAVGFLSNTSRSPHTLSYLSRAYSEFAVKGAGLDNATTTVAKVAGYGMPKDANDAAKLAVRAAAEAVTLNASSPEANLAQGYALAALDAKGKNKRGALAAFGKATFLDPSDPANQLGLGYGIRFYGLQMKKAEDKATELNRAIIALNEAVKLRPSYYEAHRELAYCYLALQNSEAALRACKLARAYRGGASDVNEFAGIELAMAGIHQKVAQNSTGDKKTGNEAASQGYLADAKDTTPDLKIAMALLGAAGLSSSLSAYLPSELRPLLDIQGAVGDRVRNGFDGIGGIGGILP